MEKNINNTGKEKNHHSTIEIKSRIGKLDAELAKVRNL